MKKLIWASGLLLLLTVTACQNKHKQGSGNLEHKTLTDSSIVKIIPEYAQGFKITYTDQACLLDIQDPQNKESQSFHYALVPRGVEAENIPADYTVIETPIRSVICMTSLQLSNFIKLEELDAVVGITSTRHLFNKKINDRLKDGSIHKIGIEGNFDNEVIMSVNPDLILISPFKRGGYDALKEVGIPLMPHLGYKEMTPLGQAEWIKFVGLLLGKEEKANEQFAAIKKRYNELKELTGRVTKRPVVFSGELRGGNWYAVGGRTAPKKPKKERQVFLSFVSSPGSRLNAGPAIKVAFSTGGTPLQYSLPPPRGCRFSYPAQTASSLPAPRLFHRAPCQGCVQP